MDNLEHSNHKQRLQMVMLLCFLVYFVGFSFISRKYPAVQPAPETLEKAESVSADAVSSKTSTEPNKIKRTGCVAPSFEKLPRKNVISWQARKCCSDTGSINSIVLKDCNCQLLPPLGDGCLVVHLTALSLHWWSSPLSILRSDMLVVGDNSGVSQPRLSLLLKRWIYGICIWHQVKIQKTWWTLPIPSWYPVTNNSSSTVDDLCGVSEEMTGTAGRFSNDVRPWSMLMKALWFIWHHVQHGFLISKIW